MVHLLSPDEVKNGPSREREEQNARVRDLHQQETILVASVNALRDEEKREKRRIGEQTQKMRSELATEKSALEIEIDGLRKVREELMRPIEVVRKEADDRNETSKVREADVRTREEVVAKKEADLDEREADFIEKSEDRTQLLDERESAVVKREAAVKIEEDASRKGARSLAENWTEYYATVNAQNKAMSKRENAVLAGEKANKDRAEELEKQAQRNKDDRRGIEDTYRAIEAAKQHLGIQ